MPHGSLGVQPLLDIIGEPGFRLSFFSFFSSVTDKRANVMSETNTIRDSFEFEATQIRDMRRKGKFLFVPRSEICADIDRQNVNTKSIRLPAVRVDLKQ